MNSGLLNFYLTTFFMSNKINITVLHVIKLITTYIHILECHVTKNKALKNVIRAALNQSLSQASQNIMP